jgi:hypothetical protein
LGRIYKVTFENVAVSALQDLFQIKGAAGKILRVKRWIVGASDSTLVTAQSLRFRCSYLPATVTDGSGGTSPTPRLTDPGDAAATFTAKANNTTQASSSGTEVTLDVWGKHIFEGLDHIYPLGTEPVVNPSTSVVLELLAAPTGTTHLSGEAVVEEIG